MATSTGSVSAETASAGSVATGSVATGSLILTKENQVGKLYVSLIRYKQPKVNYGIGKANHGLGKANHGSLYHKFTGSLYLNYKSNRN